MCDPVTGSLLAISAGSALFGAMNSSDAPAPPPVANPAIPTPTARAAGATVRVGTQDAQNTDTNTPEYTGFAEKRVSGKALGGLGRGGIGGL